jgi:hypothetical protein
VARAAPAFVSHISLASLLACGGREGNAAIDATSPAGDASVPGMESALLPAGYEVFPSGLVAPSGECQTAGDCPVSGDAVAQCEQVGGYRICVDAVHEATLPSAYPDVDQCDARRPCTTGACYATIVYGSGNCGLGGASVINECQSDACSSDADCPGGVCGPAGLTSDASVEGGGIRQCFKADCRSNADCTRHAGGVCALVAGWCAQGQSPFTAFRPAQLACVYDGGCRRTADCPRGECTVIEGSALCVDHSP